MHESPEELDALQALLEASHARSTAHLRGIIDERRTLSALDLAGLLIGMKVVSLATVTERSAPRISAVDGHFLHGTWVWSTSGTSAKARHLEHRRTVSVAHVDGEILGVFAHGLAERLSPKSPHWEPSLSHLASHYGASPLSWGDDIRLYRLAPSWMVGYAFEREHLLEERGLPGHAPPS